MKMNGCVVSSASEMLAFKAKDARPTECHQRRVALRGVDEKLAPGPPGSPALSVKRASAAAQVPTF